MHSLSVALVLALPGADVEKPGWKAGVAVQVITPAEPMWMAGYGARKKPAEGKVHDLFVKALALRDPEGGELLLLTSDLVGISRNLSEAVVAEVMRLTKLKREQIMLTVSHTHCGPVTRDNLLDMYDMPADEAKKIGPYTDKLKGWMIDTLVKAHEEMKTARLSVGQGTARFAVNRRQLTDKGVINGTNPDGPVDHDVPVLSVEGTDGKLRAVVFGYACHNTTLQFLQWCGDYAGFAQEYLQVKHPGAVAMFWDGCGGDANPLPRSTVELCKKYGRALADAVEDVLKGKLTPVNGSVKARYATIGLALDKLPDKEQLAADLLSKQSPVRKRAEQLLKVLNDGGKLDDQYRHYPVQVWRLGDGPLWIALGGEVVVDYSLRLKKELKGDRPVWMTGYANDVMAYIPSERVLKEGGYEADSSMIYYGLPTRWAPGLEKKIVEKVHELIKEVAERK
jgi:Neutral/alkaline non-lysosomal ceramidase, N-terminal